MGRCASINARENPDGINGAHGAQIQGELTAQQARRIAAIIDSGPLASDLSQPTGTAPESR